LKFGGVAVKIKSRLLTSNSCLPTAISLRLLSFRRLLLFAAAFFLLSCLSLSASNSSQRLWAFFRAACSLAFLAWRGEQNGGREDREKMTDGGGETRRITIHPQKKTGLPN
jgi:hypothetical protein